ncbi:LOW QUALITY PROTEIN: hypothetical protein Bca101_089510 [Brassica carinata]
MAGRNIEKKASINARLRQLVSAKMSEDDKLVEYDALLLDPFLDILDDLHGEDLQLYELSAEYEGKHEPKKLEELGKVLTSLDPGDSIVISKAFSHMLNLANLAEEVQIAYRRRIKKLKKGDFVDESPAATESDIEETFKRHDITPDDKQELDESLQRETIWNGVPKFLRRVDTALKNIGIDERVPYNAPLIQLSSWMGGDRDGNPRVTPEVTRDVCLLARMMAANLYYNQIENLMFEFRVAADVIHRNSRKDAAKHYIEFWKTIPPTEPYRVVLGDVRDTLYHTRERTRLLLSNGISDIPEEATFTDVEQFLEPLELCYRSLCSSGDRPIADGTLLDFLRQVSTFGLSLVRLDIRQDSERHNDRRQEWLLAELRGKRPLFGLDLPKTEEIADVLDTFKVISELPSDCFGAYIISMATSPSDVLVVELLQREGHVKKPLRVVPLFEKLADLEAAPAATAATLEHGMNPPVSPKPEWRALLDGMVVVATEEYRSVVFQEPRFVELHGPELEYGRMNIGSKPSKRKPSGGIESLRAIPWIFAWTQTRFHLPVWLGFGAAFKYAIKKDVRNLHMLQDMYKHWPFFQVTIDLIEMVFAKGGPRIAALYDKHLVSKDLWAFGEKFRTNFEETKSLVLQIMQSSKSAQELVTLNPKSEYAPGLEDTLIKTPVK